MRGCRLEENFIERHLVIDGAVKFPAQIAGEADTDGKAVDAAHSDLRERMKGQPSFDRSASVRRASISRERGPATLKPAMRGVATSMAVPSGIGTMSKNRR